MSSDSFFYLRSDSNQIITLAIPERFEAVGKFYAEFAQTSNNEVVLALREAARTYSSLQPSNRAKS